ncbi:MAG: P1 family peptidase [Gemmatimonadota bacterium]|nr:P1 family peptidase [Gemmatimonadota bacterium]
MRRRSPRPPTRAMPLIVLAALGVAGACDAQSGAGAGAGDPAVARGGPFGITAVEGILLGHHTLSERPTGCTVILAEAGAVAGVDVRGGSPGTSETALLDPVNSVQSVHGIVLSGGSAFGLETSAGVMRHLEERGVGYPFGGSRIPIVPAAILFDLGVGDDPSVRPDAGCGYEAARAASAAAPEEGSVGAGAGATVGKLRGLARAMKGGIGTASVRLEDGLVVAAVVAVNAAGDVIDPASGEVVAGVRTDDGRGLADARALVRAATLEMGEGSNTTIGVVATNARLTQAEATKVAQMSQDGLARAIYPSHTPGDGDTMFALATGDLAGDASVSLIGTLAADMVVEAILRAVRLARGLPDIPSVSDLTGGS